MTSWTPTIPNCDQYMAEREGKYEYRAVRYRHAIEQMFKAGLDDSMTVYDVGAGMTEFDYCLRREYNWRGRYIPVDGGIDGTDLNEWRIPREAHWFVALELLEHLTKWELLVRKMQFAATQGIVVSTPNPFATDVIGMDPTHVTEIWPVDLSRHGFRVYGKTFYGRTFNKPGTEDLHDSLFGIWTKENA